MRWVILIAYSILLLAGYVAVTHRQEPYAAGWVATRDLSANHLLQNRDLAPSGSGQYLKRAIKKGEMLQSGDLVNAPNLAVGEGELAVALPVRRDLVEGRTVNAGTAVRLCRDGKAIEPATVRAVLCPTEGNCTAIVVVAAGKAADLAATPEKPLSLQSALAIPSCK